MDSINWTSAAGKWGVLLAAGYAGYRYYKTNEKNKATLKAKASSAAQNATKSSTEARPKERTKRAASSQAKRPATKTENVTRVQSSNDKEEKEDMSWAKELADKQRGTNLSAPKRNDLKQKTVKQGKANNKAAQMTPESSTTEGEAGDELSPANSPSLPAVERKQSVPSGNDVSDMLEQEAPLPATLKITGSGKPAKPKREQKAAPPQETKKDRQNRKKAEEKKLQREADEKIRQQLAEKQRKTAREARGEPAKNGLASAPAPSSNAWKESQHVAAPVPAANGQLLDTLANENQKIQTVSNGSNGSKVNGDKWWSSENVPSEEEQARILAEQDDSNWNQVVTKKGKKKNSKAAEGSVQDDSASDTPAPAVQAPAPILEKKQPSYSNGTFAALQNDDEDEGWTVA
ncbi:hypothetical protein FKW77_006385 [Venturia effusa]|uniref:Uncharacterized protein n=1 Tax=Venturia effusa TaxID=50376 RepID=A0A517LFN5_9PEZI|nr:hypothetical protein FKW77_006385 [Venturia effusa]